MLPNPAGLRKAATEAAAPVETPAADAEPQAEGLIMKIDVINLDGGKAG